MSLHVAVCCVLLSVFGCSRVDGIPEYEDIGKDVAE